MISVLKPAEEELYQNYQEKALHNDSDEDADSRGSKPDDAIVVQYRPLRTSWSQLTVVRLHTLFFSSSLAIREYLQYTLVAVFKQFRNASASRNAVISSLAAVPYPSSHFLCRFLLFVGSTGAFSSRRWVGRGGRQSVRPTGSSAGPGVSVVDS